MIGYLLDLWDDLEYSYEERLKILHLYLQRFYLSV